MGNPRELYLQWLNDAYAMEIALAPVMENHAKDLETEGQDSSRVRQHLEETKRHAEMLKDCITRAGGDVSTMKAGMSKVMGLVQSVSTGAFPDELIKNALSDYAVEHFEIACYTSLIAAAEANSDPQTAEVCRSIIQDEITMADYLKTQIPLITNQMLATKA